jgi:hypothetical protein
MFWLLCCPSKINVKVGKKNSVKKQVAFLSTLSSNPNEQVPVTRRLGRNELNLRQPHCAKEYSKFMNGTSIHSFFSLLSVKMNSASTFRVHVHAFMSSKVIFIKLYILSFSTLPFPSTKSSYKWVCKLSPEIQMSIYKWSEKIDNSVEIKWKYYKD